MSLPALSLVPDGASSAHSPGPAGPRAPIVEVSEFSDDLPTDHSTGHPTLQARERSDDDPTDLGGIDQHIALEPEELVIMRE
jgi:hypothetical protein